MATILFAIIFVSKNNVCCLRSINDMELYIQRDVHGLQVILDLVVAPGIRQYDIVHFVCTMDAGNDRRHTVE